MRSTMKGLAAAHPLRPSHASPSRLQAVSLALQAAPSLSKLSEALLYVRYMSSPWALQASSGREMDQNNGLLMLLYYILFALVRLTGGFYKIKSVTA